MSGPQLRWLVLSMLALIIMCHAQECPKELKPIADVKYKVIIQPGFYVEFTLCSTLPQGCYTSGGNQLCTGPGCSNVCQRWGTGPLDGAASLGKLSSVVRNETTIVLKYTGGDPVPPPGPPEPGARETHIFIYCDGTKPVGPWTYVDASQQPKIGDIYLYSLITSSSLCGRPDSGNLDRKIEFPGLEKATQLVQKED